MATYYIDPTGVDDVGEDGSISEPWATLSYAATRAVTAGDIIYINSGNYVDNNQVLLSQGVSIRGNELARPTITTSYFVAGNFDLSQPYIKLNSPGEASVPGNQSISFVNFNGNALACRTAISSYFRNNVKIHHCNFNDFKNHAIVFYGTSQAVAIVPPMNIPPEYSTLNEIYECEVVNCTQYDTPNQGGAIYFQGQDGFKMYNNLIDQTDRAIGLNANSLTAGSSKGCKIYGNDFYKNDTEGNGVWNFFMEVHNCNGGMELFRNTFTGMATCDLSGVLKGSFNYGWNVYENTFNTTTDSIVAIGTTSPSYVNFEAFDRVEDCFIYRNHFKNGHIGLLLDNCFTSMSRVYVYCNIFENIGNLTNNYSLGIKVLNQYGDATYVPYDNIKIWNNVFTATKQSLAAIRIENVDLYDNIEVVNNIIYTNSNFSRGIHFVGYILNNSIENSKFNKNIIFGCDNNDIFYSDGPNPNIYVNCDTTDDVIVDDPLFIGTGTPPANYQLQDSSPAIDAGIDVGLVSDFIGTLVPYGSAPDIGAYEWFEVHYDFQQITLVNTPACYNAVDNSIISRWVATECPINFTLLRRDWYITNSADVGGFLAISVYGTFTGNNGDVISVYDLTTNSMYTGTITDSSGDPVLITDIPYVSGMDIKYLNDHTLYAGYYFEGRLTINGVVESLTVIASPDSFGYADLDVSGILRIKTSIGKVTNYLSLIQKDTNKSGQFTLEYRGCWYGSNEAWISEGSQTSPASEVVWYYAECVRSEEQGCNLAEYVPTDLNDAPFLNQFDTPVYWYGLPFDLSFILPERPELSPTSEIIVTIKVYNSANVQMGADISQTISVDSLEGYVNSLNIDSTLIDAGAAYFTVEIFSM